MAKQTELSTIHAAKLGKYVHKRTLSEQILEFLLGLAEQNRHCNQWYMLWLGCLNLLQTTILNTRVGETFLIRMQGPAQAYLLEILLIAILFVMIIIMYFKNSKLNFENVGSKRKINSSGGVLWTFAPYYLSFICFLVGPRLIAVFWILVFYPSISWINGLYWLHLTVTGIGAFIAVIAIVIFWLFLDPPFPTNNKLCGNTTLYKNMLMLYGGYVFFLQALILLYYSEDAFTDSSQFKITSSGLILLFHSLKVLPLAICTLTITTTLTVYNTTAKKILATGFILSFFASTFDLEINRLYMVLNTYQLGLVVLCTGVIGTWTLGIVCKKLKRPKINSINIGTFHQVMWLVMCVLPEVNCESLSSTQKVEFLYQYFSHSKDFKKMEESLNALKDKAKHLILFILEKNLELRGSTLSSLLNYIFILAHSKSGATQAMILLAKLKNHYKQSWNILPLKLIENELSLSLFEQLRSNSEKRRAESFLTPMECSYKISEHRHDPMLAIEAVSDYLEIYKCVELLLHLLIKEVRRISVFYSAFYSSRVRVMTVHKIASEMEEGAKLCNDLFNYIESKYGMLSTYHLLPYGLYLLHGLNNGRRMRELTLKLHVKLTSQFAGMENSLLKKIISAFGKVPREKTLLLMSSGEVDDLGNIKYAAGPMKPLLKREHHNLDELNAQENNYDLFERIKKDQIKTLVGQNIYDFVSSDMIAPHRKVVGNFLNNLDSKYFGCRKDRFLRVLESQVYIRGCIISGFHPDISSGLEIIHAIDFAREIENFLVVDTEKKIIKGCSKGIFRRIFLDPTAVLGKPLSNISIELNQMIQTPYSRKVGSDSVLESKRDMSSNSVLVNSNRPYSMIDDNALKGSHLNVVTAETKFQDTENKNVNIDLSFDLKITCHVNNIEIIKSDLNIGDSSFGEKVIILKGTSVNEVINAIPDQSSLSNIEIDPFNKNLDIKPSTAVEDEETALNGLQVLDTQKDTFLKCPPITLGIGLAQNENKNPTKNKFQIKKRIMNKNKKDKDAKKEKYFKSSAGVIENERGKSQYEESLKSVKENIERHYKVTIGSIPPLKSISFQLALFLTIFTLYLLLVGTSIILLKVVMGIQLAHVSERRSLSPILSLSGQYQTRAFTTLVERMLINKGLQTTTKYKFLNPSIVLDPIAKTIDRIATLEQAAITVLSSLNGLGLDSYNLIANYSWLPTLPMGFGLKSNLNFTLTLPTLPFILLQELDAFVQNINKMNFSTTYYTQVLGFTSNISTKVATPFSNQVVVIDGQAFIDMKNYINSIVTVIIIITEFIIFGILVPLWVLDKKVREIYQSHFQVRNDEIQFKRDRLDHLDFLFQHVLISRDFSVLSLVAINDQGDLVGDKEKPLQATKHGHAAIGASYVSTGKKANREVTKPHHFWYGLGSVFAILTLIMHIANLTLFTTLYSLDSKRTRENDIALNARSLTRGFFMSNNVLVNLYDAIIVKAGLRPAGNLTLIYTNLASFVLQLTQIHDGVQYHYLDTYTDVEKEYFPNLQLVNSPCDVMDLSATGITIADCKRMASEQLAGNIFNQQEWQISTSELLISRVKNATIANVTSLLMDPDFLTFEFIVTYLQLPEFLFFMNGYLNGLSNYQTYFETTTWMITFAYQGVLASILISFAIYTVMRMTNIIRTSLESLRVIPAQSLVRNGYAKMLLKKVGARLH